MITERIKSTCWIAGVAAAVTSALLGLPLEEKPRPAGLSTKDYDAPYVTAAKRILRDKSQKPGDRTYAMRELVMRDARGAGELIGPTLDDDQAEVRASAAEWLALLGDKRGLDAQARCLLEPACSERRHQAARLLGIAGRSEYAPIIRSQVQPIFQKGLRNGMWEGSAEDRALLLYGTIALARMGRREDWNLVIEVVKARPRQTSSLLEALGYVDDPHSKDILWSAYKAMLRTPSCDEPGLGVPALIELSRLSEPFAIQRMKEILLGVDVPDKPWLPGAYPILCADRSTAFGSLRSRDASNFAEAVFDVAARQPEGAATRPAWEALGVLHPNGFGLRVLKLAVSKKPHWKLVSRELLNNVLIAIAPDLNEECWSEFEVEYVPEMRGQKTLVEMGLGRFMFTGSWSWASD